MLYSVYAIRDCKSNRFLNPMPDINDETAKRNFAQAVNQPVGVIGFAPKDFDLFKVGSWNDEKGFFEALVPVEHIINGAQLVFEKEVNSFESDS